MKYLYISCNLEDDSLGGRQALSKSNLLLLRELGLEVLQFDLNQSSPISLYEKLLKVFGFINGINNNSLQEIRAILENESITRVFLDGSNLGRLATFIKRINSNITIITFFHNLESKFFFDAFLNKLSLKNFLILVSNFYAEYFSSKYSDHCLFLSKEDLRLNIRVFGNYANRKNIIFPLYLQDSFQKDFSSTNNLDKYILFVGGDFFANRQALAWFIKNVLSEIDFTLYVVGSGYLDLKVKYKELSNLKFFGRVEDLNDLYSNAVAVIAPIMSGSGMKTKVAEAFMFGKTIIASNDALIGYENSKHLCISYSNIEELVKKIKLLKLDNKKFNSDLRKQYELNYSFDSAKSKLEDIINNI